MKKTAFSVALFVSLLMTTGSVSAQGMMGQNFFYSNSQQIFDDSDSGAEVAEGKVIWEKLQSETIDCDSLSDDDYDVLGDFFIVQMMGKNSDVMNNRMAQAMGDEGEEQMHIFMGKKYSGCDTSAVLPPEYQKFSQFMPMMGGDNYPNRFMMSVDFDTKNPQWNNNLKRLHGFPEMIVVCWISLILVWSFLLLYCIALVQYIRNPRRK